MLKRGNNMTPEEVIHFWRDAGPQRWFSNDPTFDDMCELAFEDACDQALAGKLDSWMASADGALALLLLLDQLPRNIHRGTPRAYAGDAHARELAARAINKGFDQHHDELLQQFFYTPFMHSEDLADQDRSLALYQAMDGKDAAKWALHHRDIIEQFGRFPHRNPILGRQSTSEEEAWLDQGGFDP